MDAALRVSDPAVARLILRRADHRSRSITTTS